MDIVKVDPKRPDKKVIERAAAVIRNGGVVAYPTDTAYGLAVDAVNEHAIGKLFIIKRRVQKPLPVIIGSLEMLNTIATVAPAEHTLIKKYWPGPLTIIFKKKETVPPFLTLGLPTIGARMPDSPVAVALAKAAGKPLTSTSANISGKGNCYTAECVNHMFSAQDAQPDLLLDAGELPEVPVSTIVAVEGKSIKVLREGPVKVKGSESAITGEP